MPGHTMKHLPLSTFALALLAGALSPACHLMPTQWGGMHEPAPTVQKTQPVAAEPVLYARDGSIVNQDGAGLPRREVQNSEGTRTKLLELYERVVEERDRLTLSLTKSESELAATRDALAKETTRANDLETRLAAVESERTELARQNLELAGRLTTAQIRRLEAEKLYLELSLATPVTPPKTIAASMDAGATRPPAKSEPKPEPKHEAPANGKPTEHHE